MCLHWPMHCYRYARIAELVSEWANMRGSAQSKIFHSRVRRRWWRTLTDYYREWVEQCTCKHPRFAAKCARFLKTIAWRCVITITGLRVAFALPLAALRAFLLRGSQATGSSSDSCGPPLSSNG